MPKFTTSSQQAIKQAEVLDMLHERDIRRSNILSSELSDSDKVFLNAMSGISTVMPFREYPIVVSYDEALEALNQGKMIRHVSWMRGNFVYKQEANDVPSSVFPNMNSLPESVKKRLSESGIEALRFRNQFNVVSAGGFVTSWRYEGSSLLEEWEIMDA